MTITLEQLQSWLDAPEDEHIEFKEAKQQIDGSELAKYCVALANEGGGKLILGVSDSYPRRVVGSRALPDPEKTEQRLYDALHDLRVRIEISNHPQGRVVVVFVPSRPRGLPVSYQGTYLMRVGSALMPMSPDHLRSIFDEVKTADFSAEVCPNAILSDLAPEAIAKLRQMWARKSGNEAFLTLPNVQILEDAELTIDGNVTYAALILLGTNKALGRYLPQAEVIFEYRSSEIPGPAQQRVEYREGFLSYQNRLWEAINLRNDLQHLQQGLFMMDLPTFNEAVVRESILNAVSHRDYELAGSIFVRQLPRSLQVVSPGGLPPGVTVENILQRQVPRNRRIADVLRHCGLVERAGQGMDRMFSESIKESKALPDFRDTDSYQVSVTLDGVIQDPAFLGFLEQIGHERSVVHSTMDLLVLDLVRRNRPIPEQLHEHRHRLFNQGIIERVSRGRGTRYILSRRFYEHLGARGRYTRDRGLDRSTNKQLLLEHINKNNRLGSPFRELCQVLPSLSPGQIQTLVRELASEGRVHCVGKTRAGRWYPGPIPPSSDSISL